MLGSLSPIKLATPDDMGDIGTGTSMVPVDTDSQGNDMAPKSLGPFESMMLIFEEIRDGIRELVELAYTGPREDAGDLRDMGVEEADVGPPEDGTDSQGNDSGGGVFGFLKGLEIPKPGPKLGLALLLADVKTHLNLKNLPLNVPCCAIVVKLDIFDKDVSSAPI